MKKPVTSVVWLDDDEKLKFEYKSGKRTLILRATQHPYGSNTVVRIARLIA